jgi:glutamate N-acetyltransferase/amino-acid N-acetyltransferase
MKIYKKAILPKGFKANAVACGIKKSGKLDLALFYSESSAKAACCFTANKIQAAPIRINKRYLKINKGFRAIIVNSGNANCFTGDVGLRDAEATTKALAKTLGLKKESVLVASTGIIGRRLLVAKIKQATPQLAKGLSVSGINKAKRAIITTDTFTKEMAVKFNLGSKTITLSGVAKGAGMIAPHMATMLCFIFTDAFITQGALDKALRAAVAGSFNCITVDGCMSTNDSVMMLANGRVRNPLINNTSHFHAFSKALNTLCLGLAKMIIQDAEGASKFIQITVKEAKSFPEAKKLALSIANSNLFKTAMYGQNPNFGRIISALGASGIDVEEKNLKIEVSPLNKKYINVNVAVNRGDVSATVYTSDLTPEYIKINARYN